MAKKSFAVIGLGQFGISIVEELVGNDMDVIAIDSDEEAVKKISNLLPTVAVANSTDEEALKDLGIKDVDAAIVAYGSHIEASILTTVILKELGVKTIIVRVDDAYYMPIMKKLGATEVIMPQKAAGIALANRLGNEDYKDFYKLDDKYSVVSIVINYAYVPEQLKDLSLKDKYGVNIVLIMRNGRSFVPGGQDSLLPDDTIFVVGGTKEIRNFREAINGVKRGRKKAA
ncbi:MAG: TrkA family potassium uptake protein [Bacilli bacterium]|nr:TrkA family potassium uptake protein [Bacilli bacterium]